ncbi:hypothetical protein [Flexivirga oryzae]|uniref:Uncharacterized protein n=1 Tax=Flexivirga oryzae TaxID=1794944 RepID=A0A839NCG2_9MICO|nr:hypothetical protein [Flexivirga oryzae]MBB2892875.1 hypothetical protein [Flexivirga oryzae]
MQLPKRRGLALTIIGAVLMLILAPAAAGIGVWQGVSKGMSAVDDQPWISANSTVHVTDHNSQTILVEGTYESTDPLPVCDITGPDGQQVPIDRGSGRLTMDWGGTAFTRAGTFLPEGDGDYRIDCDGLRTKVLDSDIANDIARRVLVPLGIGVGLGALAFLVGVILLIVGIVKLVNSGRERNQARIAATYPGPYGGPPPYGPQSKGPYGR